jgi:quercetin dioxygenase-like cupin family protein
MLLFILTKGGLPVDKTETIALEPRAIKLDMKASGFQRILGGPPSTVRMKSGLVSLEPGETVGIHNTENKEELIIVMEGEGEMVFEDHNSVKLSKGENAYCPPYTEHNIINTNDKTLRYIYVVSILGD